MKSFGNLITTAKNLGACTRLNKEMGADELSTLLFTPQGREFCTRNDFPKSQDLNHIPDNILISYKIFKGLNGLKFENPNDICLVNSDAEIIIANPEELNHIVLLENSCLKLKVSNYAVVSVDIAQSSYVEIIKDKTSKVYVSGRGKVIDK